MKTFKSMITVASFAFAFSAFAAGETGQSKGKDPCASVTAKSGAKAEGSTASGDEGAKKPEAGSALGGVKKD